MLYLAETFDTIYSMRFLWLFVSNAAYYYALFFLLILKGPVVSILQLAYGLLLVAVFPLFWTLLFTAILFAYSKLKDNVPLRLDAYIVVGLVVALDLLYASGYAQRYFSTALVCVTLVKMATDIFLVLRYRKPSLLAT
ncbi:hypothetical protein GCM10022409_41860 [Hymenobacter glaciei]|uniref:Polysaccharide biosynthesis protein C-terminal domain-containing protein n=2 Tax=Hymenobacter glaciei TaxID=877209 RepID=A0ABP7URD7_9BACT